MQFGMNELLKLIKQQKLVNDSESVQVVLPLDKCKHISEIPSNLICFSEFVQEFNLG